MKSALIQPLLVVCLHFGYRESLARHTVTGSSSSVNQLLFEVTPVVPVAAAHNSSSMYSLRRVILCTLCVLHHMNLVSCVVTSGVVLSRNRSSESSFLATRQAAALIVPRRSATPPSDEPLAPTHSVPQQWLDMESAAGKLLESVISSSVQPTLRHLFVNVSDSCQSAIHMVLRDAVALRKYAVQSEYH